MHTENSRKGRRWREAVVQLREIFGDGVQIRFTKMTLIIASGRYFGAGMLCAPMAQPDDGLLDVIAVGNFRKIEFFLKGRILLGSTFPYLAGRPSCRDKEAIGRIKICIGENVCL